MPLTNQSLQRVALPSSLSASTAAHPLAIPIPTPQYTAALAEQQLPLPSSPPFNSFSAQPHSAQSQCNAPIINFNFHIQMPMPVPSQAVHQPTANSSSTALSPMPLLSSFFMNHNQHASSPLPLAAVSSASSAFLPTAHPVSESRPIRTSTQSHVPSALTLKSERLSSSLPLMTSSGVLRDVQTPQSPKLRPRTSVNEPPQLTLPASPLLSRSRLRRHLFRKDEADVDMEDGGTPTMQPRAASEAALSSSAPHQSFMSGRLSSKATSSSTVPAGAVLPPYALASAATLASSATAAAVVVPTSKLLSPLTVSTSLSSPLMVSTQSPRLLSSLLLRQIPPPDLSSATAAALASGPVSASSPLLMSKSPLGQRGEEKSHALVEHVHRTLASLTIRTAKAGVESQSPPQLQGGRGSVNSGESPFQPQELDRSAAVDSDSWSDSDDSEDDEPECECDSDHHENCELHNRRAESTVLPQSSPSEERPSSHMPSSFFLSTSPSSNEEFSQSQSQSSSVFVDDHHAFDSDENTANRRKFQSAAIHSPASPTGVRKAGVKTDEQSFYNSAAFSSDDDNENDLDRPREPPTPNAVTRPLNSANANKNRFQPSRHSHLCRSARRRRNRKLRLKALKAMASESVGNNKSDDLERLEGDKQKAAHENESLQFNLALTEEEEERII